MTIIAKTDGRRRNRIDLLLASSYFHPIYSGPAVRFHRYASGLGTRGVDMRVFSSAPQNSRTDSSADVYKQPAVQNRLLPVEYVDGIPVQRVILPQGNTIWSNIKYVQALYTYCLKAEVRPDLIHFLSLSTWSTPGLLLLRRLKIPLLYTNTMVSELSQNVWRRPFQHLLRLPHLQLMDAVIISSTVMQTSLKKTGVRSRTVVIPNGVDLSRFRPVSSPGARAALRNQLGLDVDGEIILFVGPLLERKGIDILVEAWSALAEKRPRSYLVLVGPNYRETLQGISGEGFEALVRAKIANSCAPQRVLFTGPVEDVEKYFQVADVFVFPSLREGMPNVVPEAFACGLASILTPFIGLPDEFGKPGEQYVLVNRTPEVLADALDHLLNDPERRQKLGHQARDWVEKHMAIEKSLDDYAALYREFAFQ